MNHQYCTTARVVCNITDQPSEGSLCNSGCSGNNNLVNGSNSCFTGGLTRWGFYIFTVQQAGTLTFTINPASPGFFDCGDYNFALFDVTNGCGSIGNALRCSMADDGCTGSNTGLNMSATDTTEGTGGDGWCKYLNAQCGRTYLLCLDIPGNDGNGFGLSFGGTCTFGVPVAFTATPDTVCAGQPVNFALNCYSPNAFITYSWNFGPNATPSTFTGPTPPAVTFSTTGTQNITITGNTVGGNACSSTASQTVFVTAGAPTSSFTADTVACLGTNTTVTYTGNASSSASYTWNFGSGNVISGSGQGPYVISYASPGTYTMSLDVTECATPSGITTMTVTVFAPPTANAGNDVSICIGNSTSLSGSGGINYGWGPSGAGLSCTLCQNPVASPTTTMTYTLAVMDANGCTNTDIVNVTVNPLPAANAGTDVSMCIGSSASLSASGGNTYVWSPATNLSNVNIANPTANPTASITYTVTVTDANGCSNTDAILITVNPLPTANAGADATICAGTSTTLSASGGNNYLWTPATNLSSANISNPVANPTSNSTYTVTVTDANGCSNTDAMNIFVNPVPVANAGPNASICFGFSTSLNASGGSSYSWVPSTGLSNPNISNPVANPTSTTTYTIIVSNGNCASVSSMSVTVNPTPVATISLQTNVSCFGGSNGNATVTVSVGTNPITYLWTPSSQATQTATGLSQGNYSVSITDANGCTTSQTVIITQPTALTTSVSSTNVSCNGGSNGTAAVSAAGGSPNYTYFWVPGNYNTSSVSGLSAQPYTVLVTDANGCTMAANIVITQPSALFSNLTSQPAGCGMTNGIANSSVSGGTLPYTYLWSNGQTTANASGLAQGNYSVTITDANSCSMSDTVNVNQDPPPNAAISGNTNLCVGESTVLIASGGGTYLWNTFQNTASISITPTSSNGYSVIVTSGNCTDTANVNVIVNPLPTANAGADVTIPIGSGAPLNSSGGISYNWFPPGGLSCLNCQDPTASPLITTDYIVIVTDANGCTDTDTINVFVDATCQALYLPNAFSPNGDGEDDEWRIYINNLACVKDLKISIWDRWGEKVFESTNTDFKWDGSYTRGLLKGEEGSAVFVYRMKAEMISGTKIDRRGNVSVVR
ncbi:MAG: gliding motility-associated C-terminal domain-containing protein [Bacteroidetes bacterium]|nr:gliding motility-associated C-terminal domain-containing protein [Bacteroidota bacterium]